MSADALTATSPIERTTCRICQSLLAEVLSLGSLYLSDFPHSPGTKRHPSVPLVLARCTNHSCGLVQLTHTTPPEWMYRTYWYRSGVNESMVAELKDIVEQAVARVTLPPRGVVVDIGANDGTLLQQYENVLWGQPVTKVAYEPARNLYDVLRPHAQVLYPEFFRIGGPWPRSSRATIITSIAMFYDLDDPHTFVEDITKVLHPDGVWVIQQAYLPAMLSTAGFDNIGHEHLGYYCLGSLLPLLQAHGLDVVDVELRAINGGSFRTYVQFKGKPIGPRVAECLKDEAAFFGERGGALTQFVHQVQVVRAQLAETLAFYCKRGWVDLYAASTKANTLLQYCAIDNKQIRQAWERSPEKWGRYVGVSRIPMVSEADGRTDPPAALLVGAWQFRDTMVQRESYYLKHGGRMIFPLPNVDVVDGGAR